MAFEKRPSSDPGKVSVTFRVPVEADATVAELVGEFTAWSPVEMVRTDGGDHVLSIELDAGAAYRFRYRLDGDRWVNDWVADRYVANDYGSDDSVIDLTAVDGASGVPAPSTPKPARARAPRKNAGGSGTSKGKSKASKG